MSILHRLIGLTEKIEEQEEEKLTVNRRTFFFMGVGALLVPIVPKIKVLKILIPDEEIIGPYSDFLAPGAIEVMRYQAEILDLVKRRFVFTQKVRHSGGTDVRDRCDILTVKSEAQPKRNQVTRHVNMRRI